MFCSIHSNPIIQDIKVLVVVVITRNILLPIRLTVSPFMGEKFCDKTTFIADEDGSLLLSCFNRLRKSDLFSRECRRDGEIELINYLVPEKLFPTT